jgi:hypothetical protein
VHLRHAQGGMLIGRGPHLAVTEGIARANYHDRRVVRQRCERGGDPLTLAFGDQARQHLPELRVVGARENVLPAIRLEKRGIDRSCLRVADRATATCGEVSRVCLCLDLKDSVHCTDQLDELIDRPIVLIRRKAGARAAVA